MQSFPIQKNYHKEVLISDDGLTLIDYWVLPIEDNNKYDNLAPELVASRLIILKTHIQPCPYVPKRELFCGCIELPFKYSCNVSTDYFFWIKQWEK